MEHHRERAVAIEQVLHDLDDDDGCDEVGQIREHLADALVLLEAKLRDEQCEEDGDDEADRQIEPADRERVAQCKQELAPSHAAAREQVPEVFPSVPGAFKDTEIIFVVLEGERDTEADGQIMEEDEPDEHGKEEAVDDPIGLEVLLPRHMADLFDPRHIFLDGSRVGHGSSFRTGGCEGALFRSRKDELFLDGGIRGPGRSFHHMMTSLSRLCAFILHIFYRCVF